MPREKSAQAKLVAVNGNGFVRPEQPIQRDVLRDLLHHPDDKEAAEIVRDHSAMAFDQGQGASLRRMMLEHEEIEARYQASDARLNELEAKKNATQQYIKANPPKRTSNEERDLDRTPLWEWRLRDKVAMCYLAPSLLGVLVMGASNVYSNLMSAGIPAFLENPPLAMALSALMPVSSIATKLLYNVFDHQKNRKRYAVGVYIGTALMLLAWTVLFSLNYTGTTAEIDWDDIGETSGTGSALVFTQLAAEILVGASLFIALEELFSKYAPDTYVEDAEYLSVDKALKVHHALHLHVRKQLGDSGERITQLTSERDASIVERLAHFNVLRSQFRGDR